jgi:hydrogenase expression/formation protein HypE
MTEKNADNMGLGEQVLLAHGGGGQLTDQLVAGRVLPHLGGEVLRQLLDCGIVKDVPAGQLALTIDGYVVQPIQFAGGDIGRLAICGTVNDLCVCGARPMGIAMGLILAEGLPQSLLDSVMASVGRAAKEAGVSVITGDTKVVGRGQADGIFITTAGVGIIESGRQLHPDRIQPGDQILINGPIADHGLTVMLARQMPDVKSVLQSDVAPLNGLIEQAFKASGEIVFMRDPTRGGLAGVTADLSQRTGWHIVLDESRIPLRPQTRHAAEMLGLDPLEVANEGKVVMVVRATAAQAVLDALKRHPLGNQSAIIGRVENVRDGICEIQTAIGGRRILQKPYGEQLPRIC